MPARCTGACCRNIGRLSHTVAELFTRRDLGDVESAKILAVLRPSEYWDGYEKVHGFPKWRCLALGADSCMLERSDRPEICTLFPYGGDKPCANCGAKSDAEARGVALMVISPRAVEQPGSSLDS